MIAVGGVDQLARDILIIKENLISYTRGQGDAREAGLGQSHGKGTYLGSIWEAF
jgi:hypothetical protein